MPKHFTDDSRSDEQLIDAVNDGDAGAFDVLYHRYRDWVVNLAYRTIGDRDASLDVMQETFLYLLGKFPGFVLTAKLTTFFYPVVRHLAIAARKKSARFSPPPIDSPDPAAPVDSDPTRVKPDDQRAALARVMQSLPETHREVVLLRFVDGLTLKEVAAAMELPLGTIKSRLHNALKTLRSDENTKKYFDQ